MYIASAAFCVMVELPMLMSRVHIATQNKDQIIYSKLSKQNMYVLW